MKRVLSLVLAALMLFTTLSMAGCAKRRDLDAIKQSGVLRMYTEAGFAPYEFIANGDEIVGVDVAIMQAVADRIGVKLDIQDTNFNSIVAGVESGKVDVGAAGITITPERMESVDFSIPYTQTEQYLIVPADNTTITCVEDLSGKQIGVQMGTTSDTLVTGLISDGKITGAEVTTYNTPALAATAIGKIDLVVTDKLTAEIIYNNNSGYKILPLTYRDGTAVSDIEKYGICVAKGNEELLAVINEVLQELLDAGKISQWEQEYSAMATEVAE